MAKVKQFDTPLITWKRKRGFLFYLFLLPLFFSVTFALFALNVKAFALNLSAFVLMYATFRIARKGFSQEDAYDEAVLTKAPKIPYKKIAALMLAVSTFFAAHIAGNRELFESLFISLVSFAGFWLYYGFDPVKDKLPDLGDISSEWVLKTLNETEEKIRSIHSGAEEIEDRLLHEKVKRAAQRAQNILDALIEEPKDIRVARKFLVVYLDGISDVITSYNDVEEKHIGAETRQRLLTLMDEVERRLEKELERLKAGNLFDLDVNIDALKEQIKH